MHLKPGRKGTKQLLAQYGDRLVCVRYRHDTQQKKRFKTVELIVAEWAWEPPVPQIPADQRVALRISSPREVRGRIVYWQANEPPGLLRYTLSISSQIFQVLLVDIRKGEGLGPMLV